MNTLSVASLAAARRRGPFAAYRIASLRVQLRPLSSAVAVGPGR